MSAPRLSTPMVAVVLVAIASACATPRAVNRPAQPAAEWGDEGDDPVLVLERACARAGQIRSLVADASLKGATGLPMLLTADVLVSRPAYFYLGVRSFLGPPTDEVWTDGRKFLWRSLRPGAGGSGPASPDELGRFLPVPLSPAQVVGAVIGLPLPDREPVQVGACVPATRGCVRLDYPEQQLTLQVDADGMVTLARLIVDGQRFSVTYGEPVRVGSLKVASRLTLRREEPQPARLDIVLSDMAVNRPFSSALFAPLGADG